MIMFVVVNVYQQQHHYAPLSVVNNCWYFPRPLGPGLHSISPLTINRSDMNTIHWNPSLYKFIGTFKPCTHDLCLFGWVNERIATRQATILIPILALKYFTIYPWKNYVHVYQGTQLNSNVMLSGYLTFHWYTGRIYALQQCKQTSYVSFCLLLWQINHYNCIVPRTPRLGIEDTTYVRV